MFPTILSGITSLAGASVLSIVCEGRLLQGPTSSETLYIDDKARSEVAGRMNEWLAVNADPPKKCKTAIAVEIQPQCLDGASGQPPRLGAELEDQLLT